MEHILLWSGLWVHEGHYVSFKILEDDTVEVVELLQNPSKEEIKTEKIYDIDEAMMFQKKLIQFGYDQVGGYFYE
jgi:hypothetical protein|tara:strand:- start:22 stop:246 length:225 start_codon:yes stop_codon:yes gene_type:complete